MKKTYKTGDVIKLKKEHLKEIEDRFDDIVSIQMEIDQMAIRIKKRKDHIWNFVNETYPGTKGYCLSFNKKDGIILIKDKW